MANIIECNGITQRYGDLYSLNNVHFSVPDKAGIVGLLGPNGSGKTTLIKILTGLLTPTQGEARIAGYPIGVESKAIVSYLSDAHCLQNGYSVRQQIQFFQDFFPDFDREKAEKMIGELDINPMQKIGTLSKGTKEKVALVLTLSRNAKLYVLDEPIAGVDPAARDHILNTIIAYKAKDATMLISTHLISEIEQFFDYVVFLRRGEIVLQGDAEAIRRGENKSINELFREIFKWL
jgi:ABC-2 type transport system ATP-binding protein